MQNRHQLTTQELVDKALDNISPFSHVFLDDLDAEQSQSFAEAMLANKNARQYFTNFSCKNGLSSLFQKVEPDTIFAILLLVSDTDHAWFADANKMASKKLIKAALKFLSESQLITILFNDRAIKRKDFINCLLLIDNSELFQSLFSHPLLFENLKPYIITDKTKQNRYLEHLFQSKREMLEFILNRVSDIDFDNIIGYENKKTGISFISHILTQNIDMINRIHTRALAVQSKNHTANYFQAIFNTISMLNMISFSNVILTDTTANPPQFSKLEKILAIIQEILTNERFTKIILLDKSSSQAPIFVTFLLLLSHVAITVNNKLNQAAPGRESLHLNQPVIIALKCTLDLLLSLISAKQFYELINYHKTKLTSYTLNTYNENFSQMQSRLSQMFRILDIFPYAGNDSLRFVEIFEKRPILNTHTMALQYDTSPFNLYVAFLTKFSNQYQINWFNDSLLHHSDLFCDFFTKLVTHQVYQKTHNLHFYLTRLDHAHKILTLSDVMQTGHSPIELSENISRIHILRTLLRSKMEKVDLNVLNSLNPSKKLEAHLNDQAGDLCLANTSLKHISLKEKSRLSLRGLNFHRTAAFQFQQQLHGTENPLINAENTLNLYQSLDDSSDITLPPDTHSVLYSNTENTFFLYHNFIAQQAEDLATDSHGIAPDIRMKLNAIADKSIVPTTQFSGPEESYQLVQTIHVKHLQDQHVIDWHNHINSFSKYIEKRSKKMPFLFMNSKADYRLRKAYYDAIRYEFDCNDIRSVQSKLGIINAALYDKRLDAGFFSRHCLDHLKTLKKDLENQSILLQNNGQTILKHRDFAAPLDAKDLANMAFTLPHLFLNHAERMTSEQCNSIIYERDSNGVSFGNHYVSSYKKSQSTLLFIIKKLSPENLKAFFLQQDREGNTFLQNVLLTLSNDDSQFFDALMAEIPAELFAKILLVKNRNNESILHHWSGKKSLYGTEQALNNPIIAAALEKALLYRDKSNRTPLHIYANGTPASDVKFLDTINPNILMNAITKRDNNNNSYLDIFLNKPHLNRNSASLNFIDKLLQMMTEAHSLKYFTTLCKFVTDRQKVVPQTGVDSDMVRRIEVDRLNLMLTLFREAISTFNALPATIKKRFNYYPAMFKLISQSISKINQSAYVTPAPNLTKPILDMIEACDPNEFFSQLNASSFKYSWKKKTLVASMDNVLLFANLEPLLSRDNFYGKAAVQLKNNLSMAFLNNDDKFVMQHCNITKNTYLDRQLEFYKSVIKHQISRGMQCDKRYIAYLDATIAGIDSTRSEHQVNIAKCKNQLTLLSAHLKLTIKPHDIPTIMKMDATLPHLELEQLQVSKTLILNAAKQYQRPCFEQELLLLQALKFEQAITPHASFSAFFRNKLTLLNETIRNDYQRTIIELEKYRQLAALKKPNFFSNRSLLNAQAVLLTSLVGESTSSEDIENKLVAIRRLKIDTSLKSTLTPAALKTIEKLARNCENYLTYHKLHTSYQRPNRQMHSSA